MARYSFLTAISDVGSAVPTPILPVLSAANPVPDVPTCTVADVVTPVTLMLVAPSPVTPM